MLAVLAVLGVDGVGEWNDSFYLSYGRYDSGLSNIVKAQVIYANYSLDIENPYADIVYSNVASLSAEFYEPRISFTDVCMDTCLLPGFNESYYKLVFVVENAILNIDNIKYSIEEEINISRNAPELVKEIENITIYKNRYAIINLSEYFYDKDNDKPIYFAYKAGNINIAIDGSIATITPYYNFEGKAYTFFTASDGYYNINSNVFSINVIEKPLSVSEVNVSEELIKPRIVINKHVRWVKRVNVSDNVINLSVNISSDALNVSVRDVKEDRLVSEDRIKVNDKGIVKDLNVFEAEKRILQIEKIEDRLNRKKVEIIKEEPTAIEEISNINKELLELQNERNLLTGYVVAPGEKGLLTKFFEWLFNTEITGYVVTESSGDRTNTTSVIIEDVVEDVEIEYYTESPLSEEETIANGKRVVISSDVHYSDILAYTYLDDVPESGIKLYRIVNGSRELVNNVGYYDENNNGLVDKIEWIVPSLSNETYEVSITILNVQSYPMVGGNWTVMFNATGAGDLIIRAVNETTFTEIYDNSATEDDLEFLDVKCGDSVVNVSVVLEDGTVVPYDIYLKIKRIKEIDEMLR